MIMIIIPTKEISKVKVKIQKMKLVVTRLLSKRKKTLKRKTKEHLMPKNRRKNKGYHGLYKLFKYFIHQIIFIFVELVFYKKFKKMQRQMPITPQPIALNPLKDAAQINEISFTADFDDLFSRINDFNKFFKTGKISYNMLKYIPGLAKLDYQGQMYLTETKRKYADDTYKGKKVIEFNFQLTRNHYSNFQNEHLCFPMKIKSAADNNNDITPVVIAVNNSFAHLIKEIDIKMYGDDILILLLTNTVDIYR